MTILLVLFETVKAGREIYRATRKPCRCVGFSLFLFYILPAGVLQAKTARHLKQGADRAGGCENRSFQTFVHPIGHKERKKETGRLQLVFARRTATCRAAQPRHGALAGLPRGSWIRSMLPPFYGTV